VNLPWTEERIETLKRLWADGYSGSCCARELGGITRNACIGKLWRLGLRRGGQPEKAIERRPRQSVQFRPKPQLLHPPQRKATVMDMPVPKRVVPTSEPVSKMLSILELTEHTCKFPYGTPGQPEFGFCGADKDIGDSLCPYHNDICYQADPNKSKRLAQQLKSSLRRAA
jgi:GcrA cell cycle regulator